MSSSTLSAAAVASKWIRTADGHHIRKYKHTPFIFILWKLMDVARRRLGWMWRRWRCEANWMTLLIDKIKSIISEVRCVKCVDGGAVAAVVPIIAYSVHRRLTTISLSLFRFSIPKIQLLLRFPHSHFKNEISIHFRCFFVFRSVAGRNEATKLQYH